MIRPLKMQIGLTIKKKKKSLKTACGNIRDMPMESWKTVLQSFDLYTIWAAHIVLTSAIIV